MVLGKPSAEYNKDLVDGTVSFGMDNDLSTPLQPDRAYNDWGTKFIIDNQEFEITVPDRVRRGIISVNTTNASKVFKTGETAGAKDFNSFAGAKELTFKLTDSSLSDLINIQTTIKIDGTNYSRTFKEEIGNQFDMLFDYYGNGNAADLEGLINKGDMNYTVNLGSGIPIDFEDGPNNSIEIPFFGNLWKVVSTTQDNVVLERT